MSALAAVAFYVAQGVHWTWVVCQGAALLLSAWALVDCLSRDPQHFVAAGKRTKGFWLGVNAAGLAVVVVLSVSSLGLLAVVANAVYLADVRPALAFYKPVRVRSRMRRRDDRRGGPGPGGRR